MDDNPIGLGFPSIALILPIHAFGICLSVIALRINHFRQFAMMLTAASGGLFLAIQIVLLRHDLLIPLYFPNWLLILAFTFTSGLSLLYFRIPTMVCTLISMMSFNAHNASDRHADFDWNLLHFTWSRCRSSSRRRRTNGCASTSRSRNSRCASPKALILI